MTIVIGIKTEDGAILASDCQLIMGADKIPTAKIYPAIYHPEDEDIDNQQLTGIYYGSSGSYAFVDLGYIAKNVFVSAPNVADLLTDKFILSNSLAQINEYLDLLCQQKMDTLHRDGKGETYRKARAEEERMTQYRDVKSFIESGNSGAISSLNRLVLRLSENYTPDIVHVKCSEVKPIQHLAIGDGKDLVDKELSRRFSDTSSVHDALPLVVDAMNIALRSRDRYTGYQLVTATRLANGRDIIRTAKDTKSHRINMDEIIYLEPWFAPINP